MFEVGDKIMAITNDYGITKILNEWEGVVTEVYKSGRFDAITTKYVTKGNERNKVGKKYFDLKAEKFKLIEPVGLEGAVRLV